MRSAATPRRFRRRLTATFVLVAVISSGSLALITYALASSYRYRSFTETSRDEVRVALALAPATLNDSTFQRFLAAYGSRVGVATVAVADHRTYLSSQAITERELPSYLLDPSADELDGRIETIAGKPYIVFGGNGRKGERYVFVFSLDDVTASLDELRNVLVITWLMTLLVSIGVGSLVARRTLHPVRVAADAATAMADGDLDVRLDATGNDEFAAWADSFNRMADALERRIDALAQAAEHERQFTADAAHDLRTPLTGLAATADMLRDRLDELPDDLQPIVAIHVRDVDRLQTLVLDLLELARLDSNTESPVLEDLDASAAIATSLDSLHEHDGSSVRVHVEPGLRVLADRRRFRLVIVNLVMNAFIHGGGDIEIEATGHDGSVDITVSDQGPGAGSADLDRIFDRFYKGDASRTADGAGLGLAIARDHARAMGGDIGVAPGAVAGLRFTVTLRSP